MLSPNIGSLPLNWGNEPILGLNIFILNHLVLEHLSGVKGGCPLEEAYYLISPVM
jgi:hypothetical protein